MSSMLFAHHLCKSPRMIEWRFMCNVIDAIILAGEVTGELLEVLRAWRGGIDFAVRHGLWVPARLRRESCRITPNRVFP